MTISSRFGLLERKPAPDTPLLTLGDVERWAEKRQALIQQRSEIDLEIADLDKKLASAEPFIRDRAAATARRDSGATPEPNEENAAPSFNFVRAGNRGGARIDTNINATKVMGDIALEIARRDGSVESKDVWDVVQNDANVSSHIKAMDRNYVYVVMRRLVDSGMLVKSGAKYVPSEHIAGHVESAAPTGASPVAGYKLVPMTKEERIREEVTSYLARRPNKTAHRAAIADFLVQRGVMGSEKHTIKNLSVYLTRWPEFKASGDGHYTLTPSAKTNGDP